MRRKVLKIIGLIVIVIVLFMGIFIYYGYKKIEKHNVAQNNANFIIENLDKEIVINEFPEKNFQNKENLENFINGLRKSCEWQNRNGKFVDFCTIKDPKGKNITAYIYEYYMICDSIRFILFYDMDKENPELFEFHTEPIEVENKLILFSEKQLKNQSHH